MIWNDERLDNVVSIVLRTGVSLAAVLVLIGGVAFVARNQEAIPEHRTFQRACRGSPISRAFCTASRA